MFWGRADMAYFFHFENVKVSKYQLLGRWLHILYSLNFTRRNHRALFWGAFFGICAFSYASTVILSINAFSWMPGFLWMGLFLVLVASVFLLWIFVGIQLSVKQHEALSLGLRDASLFLLPLNVFVGYGILWNKDLSGQSFCFFSLAAFALVLTTVALHRFAIGPAKQADFIVPIEISGDPFLNSTLLPASASAIKLQANGETRNAFKLKVNQPVTVKISGPTEVIKFAVTASQKIARQNKDLICEFFILDENGARVLFFKKRINPFREFLSRDWIDVCVPLAKESANSKSIELILSLRAEDPKDRANEIYVSEIKGATIKKNPKKIILVYVDALRADRVSSYGYERQTTPNIDRFSKEALNFKWAFTQGNWTLTSFMSIFTSLYPSEHGIYHPRKNAMLADGISTFPELLRQNGYTTCGFFTYKRLIMNFGFAKGFDVHRYKQCDKWNNAGTADEVTLKAIDWLEHHKSQDLFLMLHYFDAHEPYFPFSPYSERFDQTYSGQALPTGKALQRRALRDGDASRHLKHFIAQYDSEIFKTDLRFGILLNYLKSSGQYENSTILVTADHGTRLNKPKEVARYTLFDESCQVPFILKLPSHPAKLAGSDISDSFVAASIDVAPTLIDIAGVDNPSTVSGQSVFSSERASSDEVPMKGRPYVISESLYYDIYTASVRDRDYRYIFSKSFDMKIGLKDFQIDGYQESLHLVRQGEDQTENLALKESRLCQRYRRIVFEHIEKFMQRHRIGPKTDKPVAGPKKE